MLANLAPEESVSSEAPAAEVSAPADVNHEGAQEVTGSDSSAPVSNQDQGQDSSTDNGMIPRSRYNDVAKKRDELQARIAELEKQLSDRQEPEPEPGIDDYLSELYENPDEATVDPEVLDLLMKTKREVDAMRQEKEDKEVQQWVDRWNSEIAAEKVKIREATGVDVPESWFWNRIRYAKGMVEVADIAKEFATVMGQKGPPATPRAAGGGASGAVTSANTPTEKKPINSVADATEALRRALGV